MGVDIERMETFLLLAQSVSVTGSVNHSADTGVLAHSHVINILQLLILVVIGLLTSLTPHLSVDVFCIVVIVDIIKLNRNAVRLVDSLVLASGGVVTKVCDLLTEIEEQSKPLLSQTAQETLSLLLLVPVREGLLKVW